MPHVRVQQHQNTDADDDPVLPLLMELAPRTRREALCWMLVNGTISMAGRRMLVACYFEDSVAVVYYAEPLEFRRVGGA